MAETTREEVENRKELAAQAAFQRGYRTYFTQEAYNMDPTCVRHTPFAPTNMDSDELALADAELSELFGDAWCHQQSPNATWNQFFLNGMHYTVGEWLQGRNTDWLEGPPWLKVSLAIFQPAGGKTNPWAFLREDDEVQVLLSAPDARLRRMNL